MRALRIGILAGLVVLLASSSGLLANPDPCLVVYPDAPCTYHYDPAEYYTVGPGDPLYDPLYDRGGWVLLETATNKVDLSIYQAPHITGFVATYNGDEGYFFGGTTFSLIIDGFSNQPTTYSDVLVIFDGVVPTGCVPSLSVDGMPVTGDMYHAGDLVVSTPTPDGNNYSDTKTVLIDWRGCYGVRIWAFADADHDHERDGGECFTAFSHDLTIPVRETTWGAIKDLYR
ncbi:MAG: hypothetical protein WC674_02690 [Candidatus Krumholzibacteriia bacterium]